VSTTGFDLGQFVTERTRREAGRRLENPKVKALLDAGMDLLVKSVDRGVEDPFRFPSMDAVCARAAEDPPFRTGPPVELFPPPIDTPAHRAAENAFKKTWRVEQFRADLAMYTLTMPAWFAGDEIAQTALQQIIDHPEVADAVLERIAYQDLELFEHSLFRVQLVMQAMAPSEALIRQALDRMYANIDRTWTVVYQAFLDHYKLQLRPDISVLDITHILTATAEGLGLRRLVQLDDKSILDAVRKRSILGKTAFCLFAASVSPDGDPRTLAEFFRQSMTEPTLG
jgi:hypothetical protein